MDFSKIEIRSTIKFFTLQGLSATQIQNELVKVYGDHTPPFRTITHWVNEFKCGRMNVEDNPRGCRPILVTDEENTQKVLQIVEADRRVRMIDIAEELGISTYSVGIILHDRLGLSKLSSRWVPPLLTAEQKSKRVEACNSLLQLWNANPQNFHSLLVTGDETWVHHYDPESKIQSMEWRATGSSGPVKAKTVKSAGKVFATVFFDHEGVLLCDFLSKGTTMNALRYVEVLEKLRYNIRNRRRGKLSQGLFLLHDNAPAHTAKMVKAAIQPTGLAELNHPPYSPDLAPCDFFLFPELKKHLKGRRFSSDEEVILAVQTILSQFSKDFFSWGIMQLRDRAAKCIERGGDYVEKPQVETE